MYTSEWTQIKIMREDDLFFLIIHGERIHINIYDDRIFGILLNIIPNNREITFFQTPSSCLIDMVNDLSEKLKLEKFEEEY